MAHQTVTKCWGQGCPRSHWQTWTRQADVQGFPGGHSFGWGGEKEGSLVSGWPWWETRPQREGQYRLEKKTGHTSKDIYIYGIYIVFKQSANAVFTPRQLFVCFSRPWLLCHVWNTKTTNQEQGCANELTNPTSLLRATIESQCWTKMTTCSPKLPSVVLPYCRRG